MTNLTLADLVDETQVADRLQQAGCSPASARQKSVQFAKLAQRLLQEAYSAALDSATPETATPEIATPEIATLGVAAWFVPGRIEVFGKHTDYAGGRSVVAAAERGFCGIAVPCRDATVRMIDVARNAEVRFPFSAELTPELGSWSNYPMTVARRCARNFSSLRGGATIAFASDLPPAAGMSSSSALMVMTFLLLSELQGFEQDPVYRGNIESLEDLAGYLGTVENGQTFKGMVGDGGVGTFGGSEDHTAILCAEAGKWAQFSYCPVRRERMIDAPKDYQFVIGVSGIVAEKTGAARDLYNRASRCAAAVTGIWQAVTQGSEPHLAAIVNSGPTGFAQLRKLLDSHQIPDFTGPQLIDRFEQFMTESEEVIPAIPDVLDQTTIGRLGELSDQSQRAGAEKLRNQVPETVFLADAARRLGAVAASAQGAGFGGSVWALVAEADTESFIAQWSSAYRLAFPQLADQADFFVTSAGPAALSLNASYPCKRRPFVAE